MAEITNELIKKVIEMKKEGNWIHSYDCNPKDYKKSNYCGPFHIMTYFNNRDINNVSIKEIELNPDEMKNISSEEEIMDEWDFKNISQEEAEKLSRASFFETGFHKAKLYTGKSDYELALEVHFTETLKVRLLVFPQDDSNVCIFFNKEGICSFWSDGRVNEEEGNLYYISSNQRTINRWLEACKKNKGSKYKPTFENEFNKEVWGIGLDEEEMKVRVKAINYIGAVEWLNFPRMKNGEPYNTVWLDHPTMNLTDIALDNEKIGDYIRVSSLSQGGIQAQAGKIGVATNKGFEIEKVVNLVGEKGKSDISATQGPKTFKQSKNKQRCLVVLAEVTPKGWKRAINISGNVITSNAAYENYVSDFSVFNNKKVGLWKNGHKIFVESAGEKKRIKGATQIFSDLFAKLEDGTMEDKIIILPPRELTPEGNLEEDFGKFEELCKYRDEESRLQLVELHFQGTVYKVPGLFCWIYEDANHSATTSLRIAPRGMFNYGAIRHLYNMNGFEKVASSLSKMLDHQMISQAMNISQLEKTSIDEVPAEDFIKTISKDK